MVIFSKFLDLVMFETKDLRHISAKLKIFIFLINYHTCPIFHAENNLSKLQFNFTHFIESILNLRGPTSFVLQVKLTYNSITQFQFLHIVMCTFKFLMFYMVEPNCAHSKSCVKTLCNNYFNTTLMCHSTDRTNLFILWNTFD
jgi:hypothetical protein